MAMTGSLGVTQRLRHCGLRRIHADPEHKVARNTLQEYCFRVLGVINPGTK